ncbi:serine hydrolase domain-containing protein [Flavilitoribacter nigricans]|uniref:Beta-lactamase-related domain-containing protein n=1 Tax=Flavilitoribacter nigricans (strain ATCC 23147 / DSM 23189 / NBRC 102662 / NCIMB 1420 / SS-2) TaxID=1122177 RepID=A0A2D0N200_FLAN2|nr:serine hydrolase domain-containing protein [Flavilitoribacter nigricans]PHN02149.1 hypothetical protein CRP01_33715 [Flavilitoribacter nigricans DSM 23189 = NBRC 102662]
MFKGKITLLILVLCSIVLEVYPQTPLSPDQQKAIAALVTRDVPEGAPGVAFGIVQNGQVTYTQYAGYANLEKELKIGKDTRFNIASTAKQYTALAVLTLVDAGRLSLEDDLRKFFPDLLEEVPGKIQIKHLLTHTSGIRDIYELLSLQNITWWKKTLDNQDVIRILEKQQGLNFEPGTDYLYSNSNYILLAEVVAQVTERPFTDYLDQMFRKLGMPDTHFEPDYTRIEDPIARPYFNFNTWTGYEWIWNAVGDGNLFTTLPDQLRFEQILQTRSSDYLSSEVIELSQERILDDLDYGYGLEFSTYKDHPVVFHHGGTGAWKATVLRFPEQNLSLITLSNSGKTIVVDQNQQIADVLLSIDEDQAGYLTAPRGIGDAITGEEVCGIYRDASGTTFRFQEKEDGLYLIRWGRNDVRLEREAQGIFHQANDPDFKQEFKRDEAGVWTVTAYYPTHAPYTLSKIEADFTGFVPETLNGVYANRETGTTVEIKTTGDRDYAVKIGTYEVPGLLLTPGSILAGNYTLEFCKDQGLLLNGDRIRNVQFVKTE